MHSLAALFAALASSAVASYTNNLNYFSPSPRHPSLGISIPKVAARHRLHSRDLSKTAWDPKTLEFSHGVASGDPAIDSVVIWTRAAPIGAENDDSNVTVSGGVPMYSHETDRWVQASAAPVCLEWKIGNDAKLEYPVDSGTVYTSSDIDWTVKVIANNLSPFLTHYYQFNICNSDNKSPLGRTKTLPKKTSGLSTYVRHIKIGVYSCSNYAQGFFNAYGNAVNKDSIDYVVHLGDYIYEYANGHYGSGDELGRVPKPNKETLTLYDYRTRIAQYRTDDGLRRSHQQFPWIPVWDDHEVADRLYNDGSAEMNNTEDTFVKDGGVSFAQRKVNAVRAYFEWMPIRQVDMDDNLRIWRSFTFSDMFDLIMLDTRVYNRSITDLYWNTDDINKIKGDTSRSLMGPKQEAWFYQTLKESVTRWRLIGSQVLFSHTVTGPNGKVNLDAWDGYEANRNRTFETLYDGAGIKNSIFLAGDSRVSWASDVVWDGVKSYNSTTGEGAIGVEFAGTAVSSSSSIVGEKGTLAAGNAAAETLQGMNPALQWQESYFRGYFEVDVGYAEVKAEFFGTPDIRSNNGLEISLANFTVVDGENRLQRDPNGKVGGGRVEAGSLKGGETVATSLTHDTKTGEWKVMSW
ncbi:uncharacterized protein PgNI_11864 [Pyricularia grisea]|uniref:PhoD-like phosphatase metallophosphatase domain-containing protein n=1 Tax=Pyricularia grisea TaxID=148305 RepID=A0A6P8AN79_PYRGI|nr:uncharacterized protein PgNI_11864 [Pyricularia grisea]TLD03480.1 hypothetical protein PgNI_11864 [Pyricularia grisea]